ncbi:imidazole glycerol phosphate synthase amidotransferase subunit [Francisella sp. W12-1067]|nr:imidazole glycerol phosphate synthase amidotransferase subunit [Francisella sp. W12-1067]
MIGILNYGVGNVRAFANIYKYFDVPFKIVESKGHFNNLSKIILPGVGSFDHAMKCLNDSGMRDELEKCVLEKEIPILGICVGMQMLADSSEEGSLSGLGFIPGTVRKLTQANDFKLILPHMGWNELHIKTYHPLFKDIKDISRFYYLHSYYFDPVGNENIIATAKYGIDFTCVISKDNIHGIQCHPEKSHMNGMIFLKNFGDL